MDMVIRPPDKTLESRPNSLDPVGFPEDELRVIAGDMTIAEECVDTLITVRLVGRDGRSFLDMREQEAVGRFLVAFPAGPDHEFPGIALDRAQGDPFSAAASLAVKRLVRLDKCLEHRAHIREIPATTTEPAPDGDR